MVSIMIDRYRAGGWAERNRSSFLCLSFEVQSAKAPTAPMGVPNAGLRARCLVAGSEVQDPFVAYYCVLLLSFGKVSLGRFY